MKKIKIINRTTICLGHFWDIIENSISIKNVLYSISLLILFN